MIIKIGELHFMIDLETYGRRPQDAVKSISIVAFDMTTGKILSVFEIKLDIVDVVAHGMEINAETIEWWISQSKNAQDMLLSPNGVYKITTDKPDCSVSKTYTRTYKVVEALEETNKFLIETCNAFDCDIKKIKLWGNGKEFDIAMLLAMYEKTDVKFLTDMRQWMDVRTLCWVNDTIRDITPFEGVKHRGVDDCIYTINYIVGIAQTITVDNKNLSKEWKQLTKN